MFFLRCNMVKIAGIIAEYNPLHRGHQFHIEETRRLTQADYVIAVISGDYVQRGAPAIFDKYDRAKLALAAGVDLVIELPLDYAVGSAEYFAQGSMQVLDGLGVVTDLCFGSECGALSPFWSVAALLAQEPPKFRSLLQSSLRQGLSFPAARREALSACLSHTGAVGLSSLDLAAFLDSPNNILGLEYCKALIRLQSSIRPHTILRQGSQYHASRLPDSPCAFVSASALRQALSSSEGDLQGLSSWLPEPCQELFREIVLAHGPIFPEDFSLLLHQRLLTEDAESLVRYADVSTELANRIEKQKAAYRSFPQFTALLKTKEMTYTRIQRALLHILLSLPKTLPAPYARILGVRRHSRPLLSLIQGHCTIPVFTTPRVLPSDLPATTLEAIKRQTYASQLYESVLCHKRHCPFIPEHSRGLIVE